MLVSACVGEIVFEFNVRETGQNTALEVVIYGLMHLTNGSDLDCIREKEEKAVNTSFVNR